MQAFKNLFKGNKKKNKGKRRTTPKAPSKSKTKSKINIQLFADKPKKNNIGKVYWGNTKYIDNDTKPRRRYLVVKENEDKVKVAKLVSIKKVDIDGKNINPNVVEIKRTYKGLTKRTGVFKKIFHKNRQTKENLKINDINVFNNIAEFEIDNEDMKKVTTLLNQDKTDRRKKIRLKNKSNRK